MFRRTLCRVECRENPLYGGDTDSTSVAKGFSTYLFKGVVFDEPEHVGNETGQNDVGKFVGTNPAIGKTRATHDSFTIKK